MSSEECRDLLALLNGQSYLVEQDMDKLQDIQESCSKLRTCISLLSFAMVHLLKAVSLDRPELGEVLEPLYKMFRGFLVMAIYYRCRIENDDEYLLYHVNLMSELLGYTVSCRESWTGLTFKELKERASAFDEAIVKVEKLITEFIRHYDEVATYGLSLWGLVQRYMETLS